MKPKTARAKSKEAEDNSMVVPEAPSPVVVHGQSQPHPSLSKRAKSESHIKRIPQASSKTYKNQVQLLNQAMTANKCWCCLPWVARMSIKIRQLEYSSSHHPPYCHHLKAMWSPVVLLCNSKSTYLAMMI